MAEVYRQIRSARRVVRCRAAFVSCVCACVYNCVVYVSPTGTAPRCYRLHMGAGSEKVTDGVPCAAVRYVKGEYG